jgi:hypothetical protein
VYRHGQWSADHSRESSNFCELANLVYAIEDNHSKSLLDDAELFLFTDNTTAEAGFYKGTSSSCRLFSLILRLRKLQMQTNMIVHVIHVAGKRMIAQGTDALSRGLTTEGVMSGTAFASFVPLHLSALEREPIPLLRTWIHSWFGSADECLWLTPDDWFTRGHTHGQCIWTPPPAAADAALDQLGQAVHKRLTPTHLVVVPRLMTSHWRKILGKICDLVFTVPVGSDIWGHSLFEPLIVGISFLLCKHRPWRLRGTPMLARVEGLLRDLPETSPQWGGHILRQLCFQARSLDAMSPSLVRALLHSPGQG